MESEENNIITPARMCQRNGINRALLQKHNDIIGSTTAVNFAKKEVCDLVKLGSVRVAYLFPPETTSVFPPKTPPSHHRTIFDVHRHTSRQTMKKAKCIFHKHINNHNHIHYVKNEEQ